MWLYSISLIALGALAIQSLIISKSPQAKEVFEKVAPFKDWFGVVCCLIGLWGVIDALLNISVIQYVPFFWIVIFVGRALEAVLGFIVGYGLIVKYALSKNEEAKKKGELVLSKLLPLQTILGIAGIGVALLMIIMYYSVF